MSEQELCGAQGVGATCQYPKDHNGPHSFRGPAMSEQAHPDFTTNPGWAEVPDNVRREIERLQGEADQYRKLFLGELEARERAEAEIERLQRENERLREALRETFEHIDATRGHIERALAQEQESA